MSIMKSGKRPDPNVIHPIAGYDKEKYVKPTISNPNIVVGDFTYISDSEFESHVTHHYEWNGDKLIIGKFCQIAAGVEFVMREVLSDSSRCRICDERCKPPDECGFHFSILHTGRLEYGPSCTV